MNDENMSKLSLLSLPRWHSIFLAQARDGKSSVCGTMIGSVVISLWKAYGAIIAISVSIFAQFLYAGRKNL
jgi:hypothetical protein